MCVTERFWLKYIRTRSGGSSLGVLWSRELTRNVLKNNGRVTTAFETALRNVSFAYERYNNILIGTLPLLLWIIINNSSSKRRGRILHNNYDMTTAGTVSS